MIYSIRLQRYREEKIRICGKDLILSNMIELKNKKIQRISCLKNGVNFHKSQFIVIPVVFVQTWLLVILL